MRALAEALVGALSPTGDKSAESKGLDAIGAFFKSALSTVRTAALAATLALRGPQELDAADRESVEAEVASQAVYLDGFRKAVIDGSQVPDGSLVSRAIMYGRASWKVAQAVQRRRAVESGMSEAKNVLGPTEESCGGCIHETGKGWAPIEEMVPPGDRVCLSNCGCHLEYR
jgi:hypothetical protein